MSSSGNFLQRVLWCLAIGGIVSVSSLGCAQTINLTAGASTQPSTRFESDIVRFEKLDQEHPAVPGGTLFVGSSTFARWPEIPQVFAEFKAVNRGFGGSVISEQIQYFDRIVLPQKPAKIVFYCGDNDINDGDSAQTVINNYKTFINLVHAKFPTTKIYFLAIKISPSRIRHLETIKRVNSEIAAMGKSDPRLHFIDMNPAICDTNGKPIESLYVADMLHLNAEGYRRIAPVMIAALRE
jgi:lysophospholipase L1-like esterase